MSLYQKLKNPGFVTIFEIRVPPLQESTTYGPEDAQIVHLGPEAVEVGLGGPIPKTIVLIRRSSCITRPASRVSLGQPLRARMWGNLRLRRAFQRGKRRLPLSRLLTYHQGAESLIRPNITQHGHCEAQDRNYGHCPAPSFR